MSESTVAIYARQSLDRHGDELAVGRQLELCRRFAEAKGWTVAGEYVDNDRSATSGARRPEFERLLEDRPPRIVVWHIDRLVRLTHDLERVIDLGVNVHAVEAGHVDLSNPAGRAVAKTITAWSQYETEQKALRQRAANDQRAAAGLPYAAQRAFGFEPDGMTVREAEADELRAAAAGVLRGVSLSALVRYLNDRGVKTATGREWKTTTLKAALLSPRNAGMRRHRGEVIGKAAWPAIFDEQTATAVHAILTDPGRARKGPPLRYLLSGVMRCGVCGGPITGAMVKEAHKGPTYRCLGHVSRNAARVDEYVMGVLVARLSQPDALDLLARPGRGGDLERLTGERDALRGRLDGLAEAFAAGGIDMQAMTAGTRRVRAELEGVEGKIAAAAVGDAMASVVTADDVAAAVETMPQDTLRRVIDSVMVLTLEKIGTGRRPADRGVRIAWRGQE
ncbi:recombinase family protein [Janibacter sp. YB324]|uniref:recombinase family protein n=1 Tax=Janibacter sp. YB324 TaxID=2761047 RepID=UPI0016296CD4|nr:recombinase family protein [Janibacter sp. YB324]QNF93580.1 recombinase family protein [Janibacter sp. YB324]